MEKEQGIWKDVPDYDGLYQVSSSGYIKSLGRMVRNGGAGRMVRERILKPGIDSYGYPIVSLYKDGKKKTFTIHRIVALCFIQNPFNLPEVNHKDGNKQNNSVINLEWCTTGDNIRHATRTGLNIPKRGSDSHMSKKVMDIETGKIYGSVKELSSMVNIGYSSLKNMLNGYTVNKTNFRYI